MPRTARRTVRKLNLGVYLDRPANEVPPRGLTDCLNVRVKDGWLKRENMGWTGFPTSDGILQLDSRVLLIDQFFTRAAVQYLILGSRYNLYQYDDGTEAVEFINPVFNTGTCDVTNGSTTLTFNGAAFTANDIKAGDKFHSGANNQYDPEATWYTIDTVNVGAQTAELTANYAETTQAADPYTLRQLFSGDADAHWDAETFPDAQENDEDTWYASNAVEVVKWNGSDDTVTWVQGRGVNTLGFVPKTMVYHKNSMLYGNFTETGGDSKIGSMQVSQATLAETMQDEFAVTDSVDEILAFAPLGDLMVAYCDRSINLIQWVDAPVYYIIRTAVPSIGLVSGRALMDFGDYHEFLGHDCAYRFDGSGIEHLGPHVFREVLRQISPDRAGQAIAHIDEENAEVNWIVPKTTDANDVPENAYTTHYLEMVGQRTPVPVTIRDLPATATGFYERQNTVTFDELEENWETYDFRWNDRFFEAAFPYNLFGDDDGYIYTLGTADSKNGATLSGWARPGRIALGDGERKGVVTRIEPFASKRSGASGYSLLVRLYTSDFAEGDLIKSSEDSFDLTHAGNRFVSPRQSGLYGEVGFATTGADRPWSVAGYAMDVVLGGER